MTVHQRETSTGGRRWSVRTDRGSCEVAITEEHCRSLPPQRRFWLMVDNGADRVTVPMTEEAFDELIGASVAPEWGWVPAERLRCGDIVHGDEHPGFPAIREPLLLEGVVTWGTEGGVVDIEARDEHGGSWTLTRGVGVEVWTRLPRASQ
jgi:hypothetical protein